MMLKRKKEAIQNIVGDLVNSTMLDLNQRDLPGLFVTGVEVTTPGMEELVLWGSWNLGTRRATAAVTLLDALCATSAAPVYFSRHMIGSASYADGGLVANNPCHEVLTELIPLLASSLAVCVSIGCSGVANSGPKPRASSNLLSTIATLVNLSTESQTAFEAVERSFPGSPHKPTTHRINPVLQEEYDLDDSSHIAVIEEATQTWLDDQGLGLVRAASWSLLAALFSVSMVETQPLHVCFTISCRIPRARLDRLVFGDDPAERFQVEEALNIRFQIAKTSELTAQGHLNLKVECKFQNSAPSVDLTVYLTPVGGEKRVVPSPIVIAVPGPY